MIIDRHVLFRLWGGSALPTTRTTRSAGFLIYIDNTLISAILSPPKGINRSSDTR